MGKTWSDSYSATEKTEAALPKPFALLGPGGTGKEVWHLPVCLLPAAYKVDKMDVTWDTFFVAEDRRYIVQQKDTAAIGDATPAL